MKKCPFCKADIEDNARFCLYCMKPLNEKEVIPPPQKKPQWWPLAVVGVLLLALFAFVFLNPGGNDVSDDKSVSVTQTTDLENTENTEESTLPTQGEEPVPSESIEELETQPQETTPDKVAPAPSTQPTTQPTEPEETTQPTQLPTEPEETTQPTTLPDTTEPDVTEPEEPRTEVVYAYRAARAGDDFNANYVNSGNDIVITGIVRQSADGTYDIPETIDGRRVIAIVANAFFGSNAKIVYVPATVKNIWNHAFSGCSLTDVYFRGNAVYAEHKAFSGALTIHCSASCSDRNFRYYKTSAPNYGATWEEWNGL